MKKFFIATLTSALGTFLAIAGIMIVITTITISAILFTSQKIQKSIIKKPTKQQSYVLKIELKGHIIERSSKKKQLFDILEKKYTTHTLSSLTSLIDKAKNKKQIKGIYLKIQNSSMPWSVLKQVQKKLLDFKKSGKFIIAFSQNLSEKNYLLASTADTVVLYPEGHIEWNGFHAQFTSLKELLAKVKLHIYVFRTGKFKSAVEPFLRKTISPENRLQIQDLLNKMWSYFLNRISRPNVNKKVLNHLAEKYLYLSPEEALKYKLIDKIGTEWTAFSIINEKLKIKNLPALPIFYNEQMPKNSEGIKAFIRSINNFNTSSEKFGSKDCIQTSKEKLNTCEDNQIAILYLNGEIQDGKTSDEKIGSLNTIALLRKIKKNKSIKALVIRVNSPGGSALASDVIWNEIEELKKNIPVVTSISSMAASGGYYLSAGSNFIFAEPTSIVGSVGVFFLRPYTAQLTESLGIYSQNISTHNNIELFNTSEQLSLLEQERIHLMLKKTYEKFKFIIKKGRNLSEKKVTDLATGQYWLGEQALQLGLVDKIGDLQDAIKKAAILAKISIYSTVDYPRNSYLDFNFVLSMKNLLKNTILEPFSLLFSSLTNTKNLESLRWNSYLSNINQLDPKGILILMPEQISYK